MLNGDFVVTIVTKPATVATAPEVFSPAPLGFGQPWLDDKRGASFGSQGLWDVYVASLARNRARV